MSAEDIREAALAAGVVAIFAKRVIVLWATPDGVWCVLREYDESRYQLRLLRENGSIKSDLVQGYAQAVVESDGIEHSRRHSRSSSAPSVRKCHMSQTSSSTSNLIERAIRDVSRQE